MKTQPEILATGEGVILDGRENFVKGLRLIDAATLVIGTMIGSGIFIVSADISRIVNSPGLLLVVWLIAGVLTIIGALSYAELSAAMPEAGGQYVFLREAFGKLPAFLYGWTLFLVIGTGIMAAVSMAFAKFFGVLMPFISSTNILLRVGPVTVSSAQAVAMLVIALLTYINCRGVKSGAMVQNVFTLLKTTALVILLVGGLTVGRNPSVISANFTDLFAGSPHGIDILTAIGSAMVGALFSMDAWAYVCFAAAEVENPHKNLPRALLFGTGIVTILYLLVNISYMNVLPLLGNAGGTDILSHGIQFASEDRVATAVAQVMLGNIGLVVIAAAIMISTFGCVNGNTLMCARMYYAMAKDKLFFKSVSHIHPKTHVPVRALIVGGIWSCVLTLSGTFGQLLDYVIFATLIFYILTIIGLIVLRKKRPDMPRPYKAWGYPWLQIIYIIVATIISVELLIHKPDYTWPGLIIVVSGIPVYYIWRWRTAKAEAG
jgi:APA family basic amino acid/polyamine antiporter